MSLANLSLIIPNVGDDSKTIISTINDRMQQLTRILQYLPPELRGIPDLEDMRSDSRTRSWKRKISSINKQGVNSNPKSINNIHGENRYRQSKSIPCSNKKITSETSSNGLSSFEPSNYGKENMKELSRNKLDFVREDSKQDTRSSKKDTTSDEYNYIRSSHNDNGSRESESSASSPSPPRASTGRQIYSHPSLPEPPIPAPILLPSSSSVVRTLKPTKRDDIVSCFEEEGKGKKKKKTPSSSESEEELANGSSDYTVREENEDVKGDRKREQSSNSGMPLQKRRMCTEKEISSSTKQRSRDVDSNTTSRQPSNTSILFREDSSTTCCKTDTEREQDDQQDGEEEEQQYSFEGVLYIQTSNGQWKKRWCTYANHVLKCRYEEKGAISHELNVAYCMADVQSLGPQESKNDDLYWCYLESQQAYFCFKIYTPERPYAFRAENDEVCNRFVDIITTDLRVLLPKEIWKRKVEASQELIPLCREQFIIQMTNHQLLISSLSSSGFLQSYLPITSMNKEKSGVLGMEVDDGWREYYFVLFEGALYYYQDSKSTTPAGFVTLRFASVELDQRSISQGKFVFHIVTPLRKVSCKARHPVALSEWVASLDNSIAKEKNAMNGDVKKRGNNSSSLSSSLSLKTALSSSLSSSGRGGGKGGGMTSTIRRSSHDILAKINKALININTLEALCKIKTALEIFRNWIESNKEDDHSNNFSFYLDNEKLKRLSKENSTGISPDSLVATVDRMFHKYLSEDSEQKLSSHVNEDVIRDIYIDLGYPFGDMFRKVEEVIYPLVEKDFLQFKKSKNFEKLRSTLYSKTVTDQRNVKEFDPETCQSFMLRAKNTKRSVEIKLSKRNNMITIGRDKSNYVVIEDSRVSRSHARVEYSETHCEYIDLGSSCGSKLNGKPVLRAKVCGRYSTFILKDVM
mmetsp:Transcript_39970/g.64085  ORF Transcript_39970/g.64085 Transcript_39970/m.64085 type:complete len:919 (-) Transcript_39970:1078-3834(-)